MIHLDLAFLGLVKVGERRARRELSPVELTCAMLDRIEQLDDKLKCFTVTMADTALKEAKRAEEESRIMAAEYQTRVEASKVAAEAAGGHHAAQPRHRDCPLRGPSDRRQCHGDF